MTRATPLMFGELAEYYDALVAGKDYRAESRRLEALALQYGRSGGRSWLDVACGTGRHLELLRSRYSVAGVDASPQMLRIARRRLPGVPLFRGDMRTFRLPRSFDVVSCLYSALGHLRTERDLRATFGNFARHLRPGGVALVEPWVEPAEFREEMLHLMTCEGPGTTVVRLAHSFRRGDRSVLRLHYLVGERGHGIRHLRETNIGLLVPRQRLVALMKEAGLHSRFLAHGLRFGRGLLVGIKPTSSRPRHPDRA